MASSKITISIQMHAYRVYTLGENAEDIALALEQVASKIRDGFTSGFAESSSGSYVFAPTPMPLKLTPVQFETALVNMQKYGGSFCASLSSAARAADSKNRNKLIEAFPEIFEKYSSLPSAQSSDFLFA